MKRAAFALSLLVTLATAAFAEELGHVNTAFAWFKSHSIIVDVFDDPKVQGVSCYFSRAKTGGIGGLVGLAEDKSDASVACRQIGEIKILADLPQQEEVFNVKSSFLFKHMRIVRFVDVKRNVLIYLVYSDKLIDGSPKNSITAVPVPKEIKLVVKG